MSVADESGETAAAVEKEARKKEGAEAAAKTGGSKG